MALDVRDTKLLNLVDPAADIEQIATNCQFTEGSGTRHLARDRTVPTFQRYSC